MLCEGGGVVVVGTLPAPLRIVRANLPLEGGADAGYPASKGSAAADELFRSDLAQLPVMDCGCGAAIVVP